jgi:uncharacterized UPF0160 family protein
MSEEQHFFFEKKKQKTFAKLGRACFRATVPGEQKFFASLFSKKRLLPCFPVSAQADHALKLPRPFRIGLFMTPSPKLPTLVTHSGKFHCDEVFAYAVLRLALGLHAPGRDHVLLRTRKPELIESGNIVWDVGSVYDAATNRFDHHQPGAPTRADGTPFSSAGLIWQEYGERAIAALLSPADAQTLAAAIAKELDDGIVKRIDEVDNGVSVEGPVKRDSLALAALIGDFNPSWDDPAANGATAGDAAFHEASAFAEGVLRRKVDGLRSRLAAEAEVLAAHQAGADPRILVLARGMPWKNVIFSHELPVLFAVSPASNGNWMVDTMPPEPGSFAQRLPLPEAWAGLQAEALAAVSGVADAVFVHVRRFVGGAKSQEGALALAQKAIEAT